MAVTKRSGFIKEFNATAKTIIRTRSGDRCEGCNERPATQFHHRKYKSRGGWGNPANGFHLCGFGNAAGCHGIAHTGLGAERGWSVSSGMNPAEQPVMHAALGLVLLDDDGGFEITTGKGWAF